MSFSSCPVTITLIFANVAISMWAFYSNPIYFERFAEWPYQIVYQKRYYQMLTSAFLHVAYWHLIFNMLTLYFFGSVLEEFWNEQFGFLYGSLIFAGVYFISLFFSSILVIIFHHKDPFYSAVGASGAVCGIMFSYVVYDPFGTIYVFFAFPMPTWIFAISFVAISIYGIKNKVGNTAHAGHLGGAIAGFLITILFIPGAWEILTTQIMELFSN